MTGEGVSITGISNRINESPRLAVPMIDYGYKMNVIGEFSQIKNLDWGSPTEEYMSQLTGADEIEKDEDFIFGSVFHQFSKNYHNLGDHGHSIVVIRDHRFDLYNVKSKWIAINPVLARYLGWCNR